MKLSNTNQPTAAQIQAVVASDLNKSTKIKQLFEMGCEVKEIATKLQIRYNFAYNVITNHTIVNGLEIETTERSSKRDEIIALLEAGKSVKEVAVELKTNMNYIYKIQKEAKEAKAQ